MLFAESRRKLGRHGSLAHDRAEDLLTSTAFQLIRYLPLDVGILAILSRVRAVLPDGRAATSAPTWLMLGSISAVEYDFWPRWPCFGEPDIVITLLNGPFPVGTLVIEVKLDSKKSGESEGEEVTEIPDRDQLRRYWQGLRANSSIRPLGIVYLTSHSIPPTVELTASIGREPGDWLGWLSWRDVWATMQPICNRLPARDLSEILAIKGLKAFDGFGRHDSLPAFAIPEFWKCESPHSKPDAKLFFRATPHIIHADPHFWNGLQS